MAITGKIKVAVLVMSGAVALGVALPLSAQTRPDNKKQDEKAVVNTPVDTLLKNVANAASRKKALGELVRRLSQDEPDTDILPRSNDFIKELEPILKNAFDKENSALALDALVIFGKSNPNVVRWFLDAAQHGQPSLRVLAVNGIGRIGLSMDEPVREETKGVLMEIIGNKSSEKKLRDEALQARVLLGPPFDPQILPEVMANLAKVTDAALQRNIAVAVAQDADALKTYRAQLEPIFVKNLQARPMTWIFSNDTQWEDFKEFLTVSIKLNTPALQGAVIGFFKDLALVPAHRQWSIIEEIQVIYPRGSTPPGYIIKALTEPIRVGEVNFHTSRLLAGALSLYGSASESALPALKKLSGDTKAGKKNFGDNAKNQRIIESLETAISKIEKAVAEKKKAGADVKKAEEAKAGGE